MKYISTIFLTIIMLLSFTVSSQSKVAHIDFQKLVSEMPSVLAAQGLVESDICISARFVISMSSDIFVSQASVFAAQGLAESPQHLSRCPKMPSAQPAIATRQPDTPQYAVLSSKTCTLSSVMLSLLSSCRFGCPSDVVCGAQRCFAKTMFPKR